MADARESARERLIATLRRDGITDARVLDALRCVPRDEFVSEDLREDAYCNRALPIDAGQTISQPFIVALMAQAARLTPDDRVLEIGTGSGYAAAVVSRLVRHVDTIERLQSLADSARERLQRLGYTNIRVRHGDGTEGWSASAPYSAILVTAGGPQTPPTLLSQLGPGGRLVMPVGPALDSQRLVAVTRTGPAEFSVVDHGAVLFVPLIGREGWPDEPAHR